MEFLDISLTKDSNLLLHAIHSLFYWRILKKIILSFGFKNPHKKIRVTRKRKKLGEKTRQKLESEKTRVYAQKPRLKMPFKNFISGSEFFRVSKQNSHVIYMYLIYMCTSVHTLPRYVINWVGAWIVRNIITGPF